MRYCYECGAQLTEKYLEREGMVPYCPQCKQFRFPIFNTAVSMEVLSPTESKCCSFSSTEDSATFWLPDMSAAVKRRKQPLRER